MISSAMGVAVPNTFWTPTQHRVVRNTLGYLPYLDDDGAVVSPLASRAPIVTYISRQSGARRIETGNRRKGWSRRSRSSRRRACVSCMWWLWRKRRSPSSLQSFQRQRCVHFELIITSACSLLQDHDRNTWYRIDGMDNLTSRSSSLLRMCSINYGCLYPLVPPSLSSSIQMVSTKWVQYCFVSVSQESE